MLPSTSTLFDPGALAVVVIGTWFATAIRCGWHDISQALRAMGSLFRRGFDVEANRKALAIAVTAIERDGFRRADPALPPDPILARMLDGYLRWGTIETLENFVRVEQEHAERRHRAAVQALVCAGELSPVFGLVGTLLGFTQMNPLASSSPSVGIATAVSAAVLSTLYGALQAHFVCFPLANVIQRRSRTVDVERLLLTRWFTEKVGGADKSSRPRAAHLWAVPSDSGA